MAGLPESNAMVSVGPPLLAIGASVLSIVVESLMLGAVNPQVPSSSMLYPRSVMSP